MDILGILIPFVVLAVFIIITYLIHAYLRRLSPVAANTSTVTLIVLVVAAILFPIFGRRDISRQMPCASNMKQLALGFVQYVQDYDNKWPDMGSGGGYWASQIYSYEKSTGVYKCPDDATQPTDAPTYPISYAVNSNLGIRSGGKLSTDVSDSSLTVLAADYDSGIVTNFTTLSPGAPSNSNGAGYYGNCHLGAPCAGPTIHDPFITFLSCDGHVKLLRPEKVSPGLDNPSAAGKQDAVHAAGTKALAAGGYTLTFSER